MKKRVLAFTSAMVMVITMVSTGGLSLFAAAETGNTTTGLYDVYANGGTYGSEAISSSNTVLNTNTGDNATAIGGSYGVGINRPVQNGFLITGTSLTDGDVVELLTDEATGMNSMIKWIGGKAGTTGFGNSAIRSDKEDKSFGAVLKLAPNMTDLKLYFVTNDKTNCSGTDSQVQLWLSDAADGGTAGWRLVDVEKTYYASGTLLTQAHASVYQPVEGALKTTDQYAKFVFTKPDASQDWVYQFGKAEWITSDEVMTDTITFDRTDIEDIMISLSDNAVISNTSDKNITPYSKGILFTSGLTAAEAETGRTLEAVFSSDALNYDIRDARVHVAFSPDAKYDISWTDAKMWVSATGEENDWESVTVDVVTESDDSGINLAGWAKELEFQFAAPDAITTEHIQYVKFQWNLKGTITDESTLSNKHMNVVCVEFDYDPVVTREYDAIPEDQKYTIAVSDFAKYDIVEFAENSAIKQITSNGVGSTSFANKGIRQSTDSTSYDSFGATLELDTNLKHFKLYFVTASDSCKNETNQVAAWVSDSYGENAQWRSISLKKTWYDGGTLLTSSAVSTYEPADGEVLYATDKYVKFTFTFPDTYRDWRYHFSKVEYTCKNDKYVSEEFYFDDENINSIIADKSDIAVIKTRDTVDTNTSPCTHNLRFNTVSSTDTNTMQVIFTSDELGFDIKQFEMKIAMATSIVDTANITISVSDTLNGTYTTVQDAYKRNVRPVETTWCTSRAYGFKDVDVENIRYVKVDISIPGITSNGYFSIYNVNFMRDPIITETYESSFVYRTVNATDFTAQFNFLAGATEYTTVKAYTAETNRTDAYREITLESAAGTLTGAATPTYSGAVAAWEAYLYTPAEGETLGNYVKFVVSQSTDSTAQSVQFMGLSYTADDTDLKAYDFSTLEIKQENVPVRYNNLFNTGADINNAADVGAYRYYQPGDATKDGFVVYDFESLVNFRVYVSTIYDPADIDVRFYVSAVDDDAQYVEIAAKYEAGIRTAVGSYENYVFTPCDPADIPAGSRYLKVVGTKTNSTTYRVIRFEADQSAEAQRAATAHTVDLGDDTIVDVAAGKTISFTGNYATFAKAKLTVSETLADAFNAYWSIDGEEVATTIVANGETYEVQPAEKIAEPAESAEFTLTIDPITTATGTITIDSVDYHASVENAVATAVSGTGTVTVDDSKAYYLQTVTITATPGDGQVTQNITVATADGDAVEVTNNTFVMPAEAVTVTATFHAADFAVTKAEEDAKGSFEVNTTAAIGGTTVTVTATPAEGYQVNGVTVDGTLFGEVEAVATGANTYTFTLPKDDVTVDVDFGVRVLSTDITKVLGGSIRNDDALVDGNRGLRFAAQAVFTTDGETNTITVDDQTYTVNSYGFLVMRSDRAEQFAAAALDEGKDTEMAIQNRLANGKWLLAVEAKKLRSNTVEGATRTVEYTAVVTGLTDATQYQWLMARPYYTCTNENDETVYFYGDAVKGDIYQVKTGEIVENTENTVNNQLNEAVLLPNVSDTVSDEDWVNLAYSHVLEGSVQVVVPNSRNFQGITSTIGGVKVCEEGVDYEIDYENGRIRRLPGSTIIKNYYNNALYALENQLDAAVAAGQVFAGGPVSYPYAYNDVVYVTYDYVEQADVNESISTYLKGYLANAGLSGVSNEFKALLAEKAAAGETLTWLVIGDSISTGADAHHDGYEWTYFGRLKAWLEEEYEGLTVDVLNYAVGGHASATGLTHLTKALEEDGLVPDLISIAFGMNDQNAVSDTDDTSSTTAADYKANYQAMYDYIRTDMGLTTTEIIGITAMPASPLWARCSYAEDGTMYSAIMADEQEEWGKTNSLAIAPVNEAFMYAHDVKGKSWAELIITAINHPGQYGHGLYFEALKVLFE